MTCASPWRLRRTTLMLAAFAPVAAWASTHDAAPGGYKFPRADIVAALDAMHCRVPHGYVVKGRFLDKDHVAWAIVCRRDRRSTLLVFGDRRDEPPRVVFDVVRDDPERPDALDADAFMGVARPAYIRQHDEWYGNILPLPPIDHDGIELGGGNVSIIYYWYDGAWRQLSGAD